MITSPVQLVDAAAGLVSARVFTDPAVYELEQERIFGQTWLFVAHDTEIPHPGDYVTRVMGEDPVIVARGADGIVRVLLNACRHRGRQVCAEDRGRTTQWMCPYHGWTYASTGELVGVPFFDAYQGRLDRSAFGLYQTPKVGSCNRLIFATWDPAAPPLQEYLGPRSSASSSWTGAQWRLASRTVLLDQAVLGARDVSIFL
jgi:phenylpropionate dioxygenase-like ring-hydroxylating dioxygenase large terminal subunit